ncbi:DUF5107 domain-containing protein [Pelagicoccus albus]|uniref:DUF5107 domain-containing protein n=1 Tax=Pelagicoccus albus TaxID=415222 RepID=A0A7X1B6K7_9BACT|nr:DUF5107 domain-containing protein [Pelagicoccus albus]MBC2606601.1 DUF5107 domain-containing protein [Pelagicoccus albus]
MSVEAHISKRQIPTYPLGEPEKNPLFFEKRIYQGSSGKVYPVPFVDKVYDEPVDQAYTIASLENEYVYLELMPEIGGRIFKGQDKTNANYDFFYRQDVIKPALVGLAGPWLSGGVEFNWPQHHRPGTYLPSDVFIEEEADGARTVWMSELDPLQRMKGMHGIRLRPGSSLVELRARLFNRTPVTQTFLWWANVAAKVHDQFQSFFPPDVSYVADHAVRAMSSFPQANNPYYGVDYQNRTGANDLSWYKNIPVPTSYMVCETDGSFFGGYDYAAEGGFVHVANKHLSPGKKQWTWGNHGFGWAWDRELTDEGGPYVELMAGVYTDNQPDFSYLLPYETKTFSQFWWPIQKLGPVQEANEEVAIRCVVANDRSIELGLNVSRNRTGLTVRVSETASVLLEETLDLKPGETWRAVDLRLAGESEESLLVSVFDSDGTLLGQYRPLGKRDAAPSRELAKEPALPEDIVSNEELFLVGEHLEQYRHPTRDPELYWNEALKRDACDSRSNAALGKAALRRGEFAKASAYLDTALKRLTALHPNPADGETLYYAGLAKRYLGEDEAAYAYFYKSTWNYEWRAAAYYAIACLDLKKGDLSKAIEHAKSSLETNASSNSAKTLLAICLRKSGDLKGAQSILAEIAAIDPLDPWSSWEGKGLSQEGREGFLGTFRNDAQTVLDIAFDYVSIGEYESVLKLIDWHLSSPVEPVSVPNPLERSQSILFLKAWVQAQSVDLESAKETLLEAEAQKADYFFPFRLEEMIVLEWAKAQKKGWLSSYGLGNLYYDRRRHSDAVAAWESAIALGSGYSTTERNLGIAYWNLERDGTKAREAYVKAIAADPADARLVSEFDQLRERLGEAEDERLAYLESRIDLVLSRDDACVAYAELLNSCGRAEEALELLETRRFHPWEGGEGKVLRQYTRAKLLLGEVCLERGENETALGYFESALQTPENLGEAYHLLQAKADVNYWIGRALRALGRETEAREAFHKSASEDNDFQNMEVVAFSELSYFKGLSLRELGEEAEAVKLFKSMIAYTEELRGKKAKIDYFATSLPNLLVFEDKLQEAQTIRLDKLKSLAEAGLAAMSEV